LTDLSSVVKKNEKGRCGTKRDSGAESGKTARKRKTGTINKLIKKI